jgi:hypothetical protein
LEPPKSAHDARSAVNPLGPLGANLGYDGTKCMAMKLAKSWQGHLTPLVLTVACLVETAVTSGEPNQLPRWDVHCSRRHWIFIWKGRRGSA